MKTTPICCLLVVCGLSCVNQNDTIMLMSFILLHFRQALHLLFQLLHSRFFITLTFFVQFCHLMFDFNHDLELWMISCIVRWLCFACNQWITTDCFVCSHTPIWGLAVSQTCLLHSLWSAPAWSVDSRASPIQAASYWCLWYNAHYASMHFLSAYLYLCWCLCIHFTVMTAHNNIAEMLSVLLDYLVLWWHTVMAC